MADAIVTAARAGVRRSLGSVGHCIRAMAFMSPRDIGLFVRSARTDAGIGRARAMAGDRSAFDAAYAAGDPWASADNRYRYQRRKYDALVAFLPPGRRFASVLDVGAGLGLLARRIAERADVVVGLDISQVAVTQAAALHADVPHLRFEQGDVRTLPEALDGSFDLVVLSDTLYYLPRPLSDATLKAVALRVGALLAPGGLCLLANHFFFAADPDSRLSRRIHRAFAWSPGLDQVSEHRRPFYLVSLLTTPRRHLAPNGHEPRDAPACRAVQGPAPGRTARLPATPGPVAPPAPGCDRGGRVEAPASSIGPPAPPQARLRAP